jgi:hypothetical protein
VPSYVVPINERLKGTDILIRYNIYETSPWMKHIAKFSIFEDK